MSLIPEVKCRRCGEVYPSFRSRCPNCGTRKVSQSSRTPSTTAGTVSGTAANARATSNTKWQMLFGLILVVAVILSVVVMISTSVSEGPSGGASIKPTPTAEVPDVPTGVPVVEQAPTPTPTPPPQVDEIKIRYVETPKDEITMHVGDTVQMNAFVTPATITDKVTWSVQDEQYLTLEVDSENANYVNVTCINNVGGGIKLYASLGEKTATCIVYLLPKA